MLPELGIMRSARSYVSGKAHWLIQTSTFPVWGRRKHGRRNVVVHEKLTQPAPTEDGAIIGDW
jgi:hypothetical protein